MADIRFKTEVRGAGDAVREIRDDIKDGATLGGRAVGEEGEQVAKERIRNVGAIFKGDLLSSFEIITRRQGNYLSVRLKNISDHAAPIEFGAEYTDRGPPIVALIPWVRTKMSGFQIPDGDKEDLPDISEINEDTKVREPDGSVTDLTQVADDETIERAFWLQRHIKEQGIDAVRYMARAEKWAEANGAETVADAIEARLKS